MKDSTRTSGDFLKGHKTGFKKAVTRWDWAILIILIFLSGLSLYIFHPFHVRSNCVWISAGGKTLGFYPLNQDRIITASGPLGTTIIKIHNGEASILKAPCPHKFCQKMGPIPSHGDIMVCIPNRIIVEIKKRKGRETDAITR